eukprot:gene1242-152_t
MRGTSSRPPVGAASSSNRPPPNLGKPAPKSSLSQLLKNNKMQNPEPEMLIVGGESSESTVRTQPDLQMHPSRKPISTT